MKTHLLLRALLAFCCLAPIQGRGEEKAVSVKTNLFTLSIGADVLQGYCLNKSRVSKMTAFSQGFSKPFSYQGPNQFNIYLTEEELKLASQGGENTPDPISSVTLPTDGKVGLVVFVFENRDDNSPQAKSFQIPPTFKSGDYKFFNLSAQDTHLQFGEYELEIKAGEVGPLSGKPWSEKGSSSIQVTFEITVEEELEQIYSSIWGHRPERRNFIFLADKDDENRPLDIRKYYDVPSFKKK